MVNKPIEFNNADNYERFMGVWSRSAGELFLDWLAPKKSLRWIDVGCGSGVPDDDGELEHSVAAMR